MAVDAPPALVAPAPWLAPNVVRPRQLTVYANGLRFAYKEWGNPAGPLVLCLHGFPDAPGAWDHLGRTLAARGYRVVAPWTRGYAPSEGPAGDDYGAKVQGQDALAIATALGHERFVLVGHDWGALAAYAAAVQAPERIRRLVTVAIPHPAAIPTSFILRAPHFLEFPMPGAPARFAANDIGGVPMIMKRWSPTWKPDAETLEDAKRAFRGPGATHRIFGYYRAFLAGREESRTLFAGKLPVRTLAVYGTADGALDPAVFVKTSPHFSAPYRLVSLDGVGHFPPREAPEKFDQAVLEFLALP